MRIAIYGRLFSDHHLSHVQNIFHRLEKENAELFIYEPFYDYLKPRIKLPKKNETFVRHRQIRDGVDFMFSIGGDGTFLDSTKFVRDSEIPIMGINTGRLGFLSSIALDEFDLAIDALKENKYIMDQRSLLKLDTESSLFGESNFALNELTVHKKDSSSMISIQAYLNDEFLNSYWADGIIIATPTGSTAYSLSCGGPIIMPGTDDFVITPIAPHNLNVRPIVIPDNSRLTLTVEGRSQHFLVALDSRSETIDSSIDLKITKNKFKINLLRLEEHSYLRTIRNKLNWGLDKRNY